MHKRSGHSRLSKGNQRFKSGMDNTVDYAPGAGPGVPGEPGQIDNFFLLLQLT